MQKKLFWIVGLAILVTLGFIVYWKMEWPGATWDLNPGVGKGLPENCEQAQFPFACYLDKAMAANDPDLCLKAGLGKQRNCLEAYAEIKGAPVDCAKLDDAGLRFDCEVIFRKSGNPPGLEAATTTPRGSEPATSTPAGGPVTSTETQAHKP